MSTAQRDCNKYLHLSIDEIQPNGKENQKAMRRTTLILVIGIAAVVTGTVLYLLHRESPANNLTSTTVPSQPSSGAASPSAALPTKTTQPAAIQKNKVLDGSKIVRPPLDGSRSAAQIRHDVERFFGPYLKTLNLPPETLLKLEDLIVERFNSLNDAGKLLIESHRKTGGIATGGEYRALAKQLQAQVDAEIAQLVDNATYEKIHGAVDAAVYVGQVAGSYAPLLERAGVPITIDQNIQLAEVLASLRQPEKNPNAATMALDSIDPSTGLSTLDRSILEKSSQFLSAPQLDVLKSNFAAETARLVAAHLFIRDIQPKLEKK